MNATTGGRAMGVLTNGYTDWLDDCHARIARGEQQRRCPHCCKWVWDGEDCGHDPADRLTEAQFAAIGRRIEREVRRAYPTREDRLSREYRDAAERGEFDDPAP